MGQSKTEIRADSCSQRNSCKSISNKMHFTTLTKTLSIMDRLLRVVSSLLFLAFVKQKLLCVLDYRWAELVW